MRECCITLGVQHAGVFVNVYEKEKKACCYVYTKQCLHTTTVGTVCKPVLFSNTVQNTVQNHHYNTTDACLPHHTCPKTLIRSNIHHDIQQVGVYYDPMIAKVLATGPDRVTALAALRNTLREMMVAGLPTNQELMLRIAEHPDFVLGGVNTSFIPQHKETLLHGPPPPPTSVALAWLVDHAVTMQRLRAAYGSTPGMGAWHLADSKRLNHVHRVGGRLQHPLSGSVFVVQADVRPDGQVEVHIDQV